MPPKNRQQRQIEKAHRATAGEHRPWFDRRIVLFVVALKVFMLAFGAAAYVILTNQSAGSFQGWLELWNRWDVPHYIDIARDGYVATDLVSKDQRLWIVFYPLYPWLLRLFGIVLRDYVLSFHVVSLIGSVAAGLLFYRLARLDLEDRLARAAVFFMFVFPTAYFFHTGYTESVFMPLVFGSLLAARKERWALAGALGALAALTRVNGMLLIPVLAVEAFMQYRRDGRTLRREWLWILLTSVGFLVYLSINYSVWGDAFYFQKVMEKYWYKKLTWPWVGIGGTLEAAWTRDPAEAHLVGVQEFFFITLGAACTVWAWRRLRPSYAVWMTLNWLLVTSTSHVMSTPRYTLSMFPIFLLFAQLAEARPNWGAAVTVWSLTFLGIFTALFVQGHWAF